MRKLIISLKDKLLYQIFTIHGSDYRKWLLDYVCVQPIARVLSFLHCILSYCQTCQEMEEGTSSSKITFYATTNSQTHPTPVSYTHLTLPTKA